MTPKEKARQLFKEYYDNLTDVLSNNEAKAFAFVCSIICVNEILQIESNNYWKEVRDELHLISEE